MPSAGKKQSKLPLAVDAETEMMQSLVSYMMDISLWDRESRELHLARLDVYFLFKLLLEMDVLLGPGFEQSSWVVWFSLIEIKSEGKRTKSNTNDVYKFPCLGFVILDYD